MAELVSEMTNEQLLQTYDDRSWLTAAGKVKQELRAELLHRLSANSPGSGPKCPKCGEKMHNMMIGRGSALSVKCIGEGQHHFSVYGNALRTAIRALERLRDGKATCKEGPYKKADNEVSGIITTALSLAKVALGAEPPRWPYKFSKPLEEWSPKELCDRFASTYQIHSNPGIYRELKAGHDEILRRLQAHTLPLSCPLPDAETLKDIEDCLEATRELAQCICIGDPEAECYKCKASTSLTAIKLMRAALHHAAPREVK